MENNLEIKWIEVAEVYQPDEAQLMQGLLNMAGIKVKIEKDSMSEIYGLTIGPLAKIQILVPEEQLTDAENILAGKIDDLGLDREE